MFVTIIQRKERNYFALHGAFVFTSSGFFVLGVIKSNWSNTIKVGLHFFFVYYQSLLFFKNIGSMFDSFIETFPFMNVELRMASFNKKKETAWVQVDYLASLLYGDHSQIFPNE